MGDMKLKSASDDAKSITSQRQGATSEIIITSQSDTPKRFNLYSVLGISFSITATPLGIGSYLAVVIGVGGSPVYLYGYIVAVALNLLVCLSLAEIAAVHPHASGKNETSPS